MATDPRQSESRLEDRLEDRFEDRRLGVGRSDWSSWPTYEAAALGLPGSWWYPVMWSARLGRRPVAEQLLGERVVFARDGGQVVASNGPDSPPVAERLGLIWVFMGDGEGHAPPVEQAIPRELLEHDFVMGGNVETRQGGWRFGAENGYDEGHAKYLHRNSLWRLFRLMPTWTRTRVVPTDDGWITRVQTEVHWEADFPGLGTWSGKRWWKRGASNKVLGASPSRAAKADPVIASLDVPGNQSIRLPGLLRIVHSRFIHYEWYVPVDEDRYKYVQIMVEFKTGLAAQAFKLRYLLLFRWLFHGQFSAQDEWMVNVMDAPPERLYRPDVSITAWRRLCEQASRDGQAVRKG